MTPQDWRLVSMWEGDPVGVDQKRPLVGFALVAVLCAVLMGLSVGQGWGVDIFRPGKPIAVPAEAVHVAPAQVQPREPEMVSIPDELSAQPLGVAVPEPLSKRIARATAQSPAPPVPAPATQAPATQAQSDEQDEQADDAASSAPERQADAAAERAERKAHQAELKALRATEKAARKAQREVEKAAARAQREAEKAADQAQRDADKAAQDAAKAAEQAVRDAAKLAREAVKAHR